MRRSIAALALIRHDHEGETLWLVRWNQSWRALSFVGGHKRADETFRECVIREVTEELGLQHRSQFTVSDTSRRLPDFIDWSQGAGQNTQYTIEFFEIVLSDAAVHDRVSDDPENCWLTVDEIKAKCTKAGRSVSPSVAKLLEKLDLLNVNRSVGKMNPSAYEPKPIDTSTVELPETVFELTERLAENAHDIWATGRLTEGWTYGPERNDDQKKHPCLVPYADLPESEKEYDRNSVLATLKAIIALGYRIDREHH